MRGDWKTAKAILDNKPELIHYALTENHEVVLHVASAAKSTKSVDEFVKNLLNLMEAKDLELQNKSWDTAFCLAASAGNIETAKAMVEKNPTLIEMGNSKAGSPLYMASKFGKAEMVRYLYDISKHLTGKPWEDNLGWALQNCINGDILDGLLHKVTASSFVDVALKIVNEYPQLIENDRHPQLTGKKVFLMSLLLGLATKTHAFEEIKPHIIFRIINSMSHIKVGPTEKETEAMQLLRIIWKKVAIMKKTHIDNYIICGPPIRHTGVITGYPSRPLFLAAKMGNTRFIVELIQSYPDLVWKPDDKGKTIFHVAIKHRQANIYNLLYEIGAMRDLVTTVRDNKGNTLLHMVAKKAKGKQFQNVAGAALQMQQELLWFKEVEQMVPLNLREEKNNDGKTPQDLFSDKHAALVSKGESWMKNYMLVATLIATVVFAAAFTLPGGYNQNTGIPFFRNEPSLIIFVISDAVSLISSSTSILIFLSMLTSSYAELDLLESLPEKLMFGLTTLFLAIVSMMVAFSTSFFVIYNKSSKWLPVTVTCLAAMPIILFAKLQFRFLGSVFYSAFRSRSLFKPKKQLLYD